MKLFKTAHWKIFSEAGQAFDCIDIHLQINSYIFIINIDLFRPETVRELNWYRQGPVC